VDDFDAECQQAESAIAALQELFERSPELGSITVQKRFGQKQERKCASFSVTLKKREQLESSTFALLAQQLWQMSQGIEGQTNVATLNQNAI
jgi:hypothetical protein